MVVLYPGGSNRGQGRRKFNNFNPDNYNSNAEVQVMTLANGLCKSIICPVTALFSGDSGS